MAAPFPVKEGDYSERGGLRVDFSAGFPDI
jgi:hypothetical protein